MNYRRYYIQSKEKMIVEVPKQQTDMEKELNGDVFKICQKYNIDYNFVLDSKTITECINAIARRLYHIKEITTAMYSDEQ